MYRFQGIFRRVFTRSKWMADDSYGIAQDILPDERSSDAAQGVLQAFLDSTLRIIHIRGMDVLAQSNLLCNGY